MLSDFSTFRFAELLTGRVAWEAQSDFYAMDDRVRCKKKERRRKEKGLALHANRLVIGHLASLNDDVQTL